MRFFAFGAVLSLAAFALASPAEAKKARCFSTDDGFFACDFKATDRSGSFEISARGFPTYSVMVDEPGIAYVSVNLGTRFIPLAGLFRRSEADGACWENADLGVKVCAW